jgi:GNAT superfamily N-acetyltransferase
VAWTDPQVCTAALRRLLDTGHRGAVAIEGGRTLAVLTGTERGTYARLLAEGVAAAPDLVDPTRLLVRVYGDLAPGWVAKGLLGHGVDHVALPRLDEAWSNLGFGRHHVFATQPAVPRSRPTNVQVRVADGDDLEIVARLALVEIEFRGTPPIYSSGGTRSVEGLVEEHLALREAGATHLVAALDGRDVGLLAIEMTSPAPRLCPEGQPYIGPTATLAEARGQGVGRALVDTALNWAHTQGYQWVSVDFESANPLSRSFWIGNGFRPTGYCVVRAVQPADQRAG